MINLARIATLLYQCNDRGRRSQYRETRGTGGPPVRCGPSSGCAGGPPAPRAAGAGVGVLLVFLLPAVALAQAPPRLADLAKQASTWPPACGALARDVASSPDDFEKIALERVGKLLA